MGAGVILMLFSSVYVALMREHRWASCIGDPGSADIRLAIGLAGSTHLEFGTEYMARQSIWRGRVYDEEEYKDETRTSAILKKRGSRQVRMATSILQLA